MDSYDVIVVIVGVVQALPVVGALRPDFEKLYGVATPSESLRVLMRNRAVYLGGVGGLLVWSSFRPSLQIPAIALSILCLGSFLALAVAARDLTAPLRRLVVVDVVLVALLVLALILRLA